MKKIKFLLLSFLTLTALNSCNKETEEMSTIDQEKNAKLFLESVEIKPASRIELSNGKFARTFTLKLHDSNYKPMNSYIIDSEDFTDDGKFNDLRANDGIYTSILQQNDNVAFDQNTKLVSFKSESFKYNTNSRGGEFGCKIRHVRTGTSVLGFSCNTSFGCYELYDCEFKITW